jgi:hypothetical protein
MRALIADSSAPGRLALREVPDPVPAPGEVLVAVRGFSLNRGELRMLGSAADGWRPGWDFAGVLQSDVEDGPRAGARVVGIRQSGTWEGTAPRRVHFDGRRLACSERQHDADARDPRRQDPEHLVRVCRILIRALPHHRARVEEVEHVERRQ